MARRKPKPYEVVSWMRVLGNGEPVRRARARCGFTQRELAFLVKRSQTTIYQIERGQLRTITDALAFELARRLGRDWEELFASEEAVRVSALTNDSGTATTQAISA